MGGTRYAKRKGNAEEGRDHWKPAIMIGDMHALHASGHTICSQMWIISQSQLSPPSQGPKWGSSTQATQKPLFNGIERPKKTTCASLGQDVVVLANALTASCARASLQRQKTVTGRNAYAVRARLRSLNTLKMQKADGVVGLSQV